ncbi:PREDICTED: dynein heavy chain 12, axonemal [Dinoponera quadriceps]|uniref:Dynein heavy chain 12, axonemal n=1 Tax=Dinoponera quadriceps TaxID=609295 RepID=A0A6P3X0M7_DINQU|nr:PREDICTED: dynein heavy chain 12, axonemal [Dinoponera quadriceps]
MVGVSDYRDISRDGSDATKEWSSTPDVVKTVSDDAERRGLRRFKLDKLLTKEVQDALEAASVEAKMRHREIDIRPTECEITRSQDFYFNRMKEAAENAPITGLLPEWEERIRELAGRSPGKYADFLEEQMWEMKERYRETMRRMAIRRIIAIEEEEENGIVAPYKHPGRTESMAKFQRNRCALAKQYHLSHRLIRSIVAKAQLLLPEVLCDIRRYRGLNFLDLDRFLDSVEADLKKSAHVVIASYYSRIVRTVSQRRNIQDVAMDVLLRFLKCATRLLGLQIVNRVIVTIERLLTVLGDSTAIPLLRFELKCEKDDLFVNPRLPELHEVFHRLVDNIARFARHLPPLESWARIRGRVVGMTGASHEDYGSPFAAPPDWYLDEAHQRLDLLLRDIFRPLNDYVEELRLRFGDIYRADAHRDAVEQTEKERSLEECVAQVEDFNRRIRDINGMPDNEYLSTMSLHQVAAKRGLASYASELRALVIDELVKRHWNYNVEICNIFERLRDRALNVPRTTKEMLELGQYMLMATSTLMREMQEKITLSLRMVGSLIEMTSLSKSHIELNNTTVQWLKRIKPVFDRSSSMYEQMKFELEEKLQEEVVVLNANVENMFPRLVMMDDMDDIERVKDYIEDMRKMMRQLERMEQRARAINAEESLFQFPLTQYPRIQELRDNILPFYHLIYKAYQWQRDRALWLDGPFEYLDVQYIEDKINQYLIDFNRSYKLFKTRIKMQIATNYPYSFAGLVDDPDPFQQPSPQKLCYQLMENGKWFKRYIPLLAIFRNPAMRQLHWDNMSGIAEFDLTPDAGTTLRKIINMNLLEDLEKYEIISSSATKELVLEDSLAKMKSEWDDIIFTTTPYKDTRVSILMQLDDVLTLLEEHIIKLQMMRGSAFVKLIEEDVKVFYALLLRVQSTIDEWTKVQMQWMYLLPIFSSKDIVEQLPDEEVLFIEVDATFRKAMQRVDRDPRVRETAGVFGMLESMLTANMIMERVNNGVLNYLEKKRLFFPRFFFLSNDDMLEILSETKEPLRVQPHLKKCFEGINRLGFDKDLEIYCMFSDDKEEVPMQEVISTAAARGCVERWLLQVEKQMLISVREEIYLSYLEYELKERVEWVVLWPGMVVLCVAQIYWSLDVHSCLVGRATHAMESLYEKLRGQILKLVNLGNGFRPAGQLSKQNRTTLNALITIDVHAMDVVKSLIEKQIVSEMDFEWLSQLRYYWEDDVYVRIIYSTVRYAYEYLGNCSRLVITPLTDRCYRTLIGAYSLHLNGAPEGPAGTGKTETTKDLSRAIAVQCVVFNCSEGLDYKNMGKFFKGLASCGAWSCFDEFNRIELEVLSVVAQQILCIIQAVRGHLETFVFEGTELQLNPAVYVCITMNPGYAGRSELPDNLKVLFRTVAMMVPDYAMIAEIFLYSSGFGTGRDLSTKIVTTYKLCSEQLSSQSHYDYGMRAVKTVLSAAQSLKLKHPDEDEAVLLLRSLIDVNLPKFLSRDVPLFQGIVSDLFPGLSLPEPSYEQLLTAVKEAAQRRNLQPVSVFLLKIVQTYEMMMVRHGFMLVGEPFSSKSSVLRTLADALTLMQEHGLEDGVATTYFVLNPKAVTLGQLYGYFDPVSSEWSDGVCAAAFRRFSSEDSPDRRWIIFDGPVDAVWIESLNTVLDDNKKLCLTSGEVMRMSDTMSMIFETMDLMHASPATVSRCGMIYMEPRSLGWQPLLESWLVRLNPAWCNAMVGELFLWLMQPCLNFIRGECRLTVNAGEIHRAVSTMSFFELLIEDAVEESPGAFEQNLQAWFQAAMIVSMVWGAAGTLDWESRAKFDVFYRNLWKNEHPDFPTPECVTADPISLPGDEPIHDQYYHFRGRGAWRRYTEAAKTQQFSETESIARTIIPTGETVKYQSVMTMHIRRHRCFLLYGDTGTGKSIYVKDLLTNRLDETKYLPNLITFSPRITAAQTQELVLVRLLKRRGGTQYGPPHGTHCIVFVDEVNAPTKEIYGAQPPIELLRQFLDHGVWFDLKKPDPLVVLNTMFVCAMAPPGGRRHEIYQRFLRHFNVFTICDFTRDTLFRIFTNLAFVGLKQHGFTAGVMPLVNDLVNATTRVYRDAITYLRPTPLKPHYLFNLRDFARVITGCALLKKESADTGKSVFCRLWVHEVLRVFGDRLVDQPDRRWLCQEIRATVEIVLKERFDALLGHLPRYNDQITEESLNDLIMANFMDPEVSVEFRLYEEIPSLEECQRVALLFLQEYNDTHRDKIDITLFRYALQHLARICRVLSIPCGSLLMIGTGGSGRQSLTRLASAIAGYGLRQPEITGMYGLQEWREDVKWALKNSGGVGKDLVFLLAEEQIRDDAFLDDVDSLLNDGEVPNIFNVEERQEIVEMTRLAAQGGDRNLDISVLSVLAFFVARCREKLHIMLCLSPIGDAFRIRVRMHPGLVNCCTIDWFDAWPEDALEQVARRTLVDLELAENVKDESVAACKFFHSCTKDVSARFYELTGKKTYVTTASFLDLMRMFADLTTEKRREIAQTRERYINGLDKLEFAAEQIAQMRITLTELRPQLEASAKETAETMRQIEKEDASVKQATILVKKDENVAKVQAEIAMQLKEECEADLAEALPALAEAIAALDTLKPADIAVVKTMKSPPEVIKLVMAAVCVMLNVPPVRKDIPATGVKVLDYWTPSKRILGDMKFLESLRQYDKDNIPEAIMQEIKRTYMTNVNFDPKVVARASSAAEGLCKWVRAMVLYDGVAKIVAPKKAKLAASERDLKNTLAFLEERRLMLAELNERLKVLREKLNETLTRKIRLEDEVTNCRNKLIRAEKLISGLGGERDRWTAAAEMLWAAYEALPGDILISCGVIAYLGPYTASYRTESLDKWTKYVAKSVIPCSREYNFVAILGTEVKINSWNLFGLPRDSFSIENAIIMDNSKRWSLFVDPQGQTNKWIRNMEKMNDLRVVKLTDRNYMNVVERSIEQGKPVLIENIMEELDAALDPILMRRIYKSGGFWYITLGERNIDYNPRFRLYMTTKLRNPHYSPEVFNKVTLISSALTLEALDDQLLGIVVAKERPDLQEKREYLIVQNALNVKALKEVEDNILRILSVAGAGILEDEEAIGILDSSKILSSDIEKKQVAAKKTAMQIDMFRQSYRPIAKYSAALYYTITDLPNIDPMYQYSLTWFINLYVGSIETASKSKDLERRLGFLRSAFTYNLYQNVCRSLFEKDKILYSFILYTTILLASGGITEDEMSFLITGGFAVGEPTVKNPAAEWLPEKSWSEISRIVSASPAFMGFMRSFRDDLPSWKKFYDLLDPVDASLPQPWETRLTPFQKLIVARVIRPDIVPIKIQRFVEAGMGLKFVVPPPFDLAKSYAESNCLTPLVFILSAGSDPMGALTKFVESMNYMDRFESISLGQGQGPIAQRMIERAQGDGSWVCLQNCHLAASWMPVLEKIYECLDHVNTEQNFRLWLTSYPSDKFPVSVLQNGVKMTNEPPMGLQNNILRSFTTEGTRELEALEEMAAKKKTFFRMLYALCFFHAVIQERRNYGPQGWNIRYDFNESDLQISAMQLELCVAKYEKMPFDAIMYLTGECNYGGRVTDDRDRRCLNTILKDFYNPDVIVNPNYSFAPDVGPEYTVPKRHTHEDYMRQIQSIPLNPSPEVFGLHMNAGINRNLGLTADLFDSMARIQGGVVTGDAMRQDEILLNMKRDIYERMPNLFDIEEAQRRFPIEYMESMNTVLVQEVERYNDLLAEIRSSLSMLEKAVKGLVVMTPLLEEVANSMLIAKIPPSWARASAYPSLKRLPSFVEDFLKRIEFLQHWLDHGKPQTFWISGFSFAHAFLTAITQNYARKYKIPIDKITFDYEVLPIYESSVSPVDGAFVYGTFLAGARWDIPSMLLAESYPKILWDPMPMVWFKPCEIASLTVGDRYECPLYITSARFGVLKTTGHSSNYVLSIFLDTDRPVSHWIKRGLALLCQLDD